MSAADISRDERLTRSYVTRVLRIAFLAPVITEAVLNGRQPPELNAERLVRSFRLPLGWDDQRDLPPFGRRGRGSPLRASPPRRPPRSSSCR